MKTVLQQFINADVETCVLGGKAGLNRKQVSASYSSHTS